MRKGNKYISREELFRYKRGEMSNEEMHAFERKISEDSFLLDAGDGLEDIVPNNLERDIENMDYKMQQMFLKDVPEPRTRFPLLKIAASIVILLFASATGYLLITGLPDNLWRTGTVTMTEEKEEEKSEAGKQISDAQQPEITVESVGAKESEKIEEEYTTETEQPTELEPVLEIQVEEEETADPFAAGADEGDIIEKIAQPEELSIARNIPGAQDTIQHQVAAIAGDSETLDITGITPPFTTHGRIMAASGNTPLAGADVGLLNSNQRTITDEDGYFSLNTSEKPEFLFAYAEGYIGNIYPISSNESITIQLATLQQKSLPALAQPVALERTDQAREKRSEAAPEKTTSADSSVPVPSISITQYKQYMSENLNYPEQALQNRVEGKVILEITIDENGMISNTDVLLGLGFGCDEEAQRLIREGPAWQPAMVNGNPYKSETQLAVEFSIK